MSGIGIEDKILFILNNGGDIRLNIGSQNTLTVEEYKGVKTSYWFLCNECKNEWFNKTLDAYWNGKAFKCKTCYSKNNKNKNKMDYKIAVDKIFEMGSKIYTLSGEEIDECNWGRVIDKYTFECTECGKLFEKEYRGFLKSPMCNKCLGLERWNKDKMVGYVSMVGGDIDFINECVGKSKQLFTCISEGCENKFKRSWNKFYYSKQHYCLKCSRKMLSDMKSKTKECYLKELGDRNIKIKLIGDYINTNSPTQHECPRCGNRDWFPTPSNVLSGKSNGCILCMVSKGEERVQSFLEQNNIGFIKEKTFENLLSPRGYNLRFDFFLQKEKVCIEYDGEQHYKVVKGFNTEESLAYSMQNDDIKNNYCKTNGIKMIRIPHYDFDNIENILAKELEVAHGQK